jgi:hypothetical protein
MDEALALLAEAALIAASDGVLQRLHKRQRGSQLLAGARIVVLGTGTDGGSLEVTSNCSVRVPSSEIESVSRKVHWNASLSRCDVVTGKAKGAVCKRFDLRHIAISEQFHGRGKYFIPKYLLVFNLARVAFIRKRLL